ncbi:MAG: polyphosphate:AMP phosphotransferase [Pseudazoarcus pumilus]|nr:polyphosphate:AMP phosphotransferase [Pseudazoarcus pumilus]
MFDSAEIGHKVGKREFRKAEDVLRTALLDAQYELLESRAFSVVVLVNGVEGAGKGETVNLLTKWMDPRHIEVRGFDEPSTEEAERPYMWRFWRVLPPRGKQCVMFGDWYAGALRERLAKETSATVFEHRLDEINRFEAMLAREQVVLVKLWFHLSKAAQKRRFDTLSADDRTRWRVTEEDWAAHERYDRSRELAEAMLRATDSASAPWIVIDSEDANHRSLAAGRAVLEAITRQLARSHEASAGGASRPELPALPDRRTFLDTLDLAQKFSRKEYDEQLEVLQGRLALLTRHKAFRKRSLVLVFEGMDAAGKGGAIRRVTAALDARHYRVIPVAAPTDEEAARPYLWRFWRHVPRQGKTVIFDRSWYGRVLVERVEGFAAEPDWMRAYGEINDFEQTLEEAGAVVVKFWLAISSDEQLRRFREREAEAHKRFKITPEDWRNRHNWAAYEEAVCDMLERTGGPRPWTLVEADNKHFARIKVLRTICERLEAALAA